MRDEFRELLRRHAVLERSLHVKRHLQWSVAGDERGDRSCIERSTRSGLRALQESVAQGEIPLRLVHSTRHAGKGFTNGLIGRIFGGHRRRGRLGSSNNLNRAELLLAQQSEVHFDLSHSVVERLDHRLNDRVDTF